MFDLDGGALKIEQEFANGKVVAAGMESRLQPVDLSNLLKAGLDAEVLRSAEVFSAVRNGSPQ
jgi:hypothetical protein